MTWLAVPKASAFVYKVNIFWGENYGISRDKRKYLKCNGVVRGGETTDLWNDVRRGEIVEFYLSKSKSCQIVIKCMTGTSRND